MMQGVMTTWEDVERLSPRVRMLRHMSKPEVFGVEGPQPNVLQPHELTRMGATAEADVLRGYIKSYQLEDPIQGRKIAIPPGSASFPSLTIIHGPAGALHPNYDVGTGFYSATDGEFDWASNNVYALSITRTGLKQILGAAASGTLRQVASEVGTDIAGVTVSAAGVEEVIATVSVPGNALNENGRGVHIEAAVETAANGNNKTIKLRWGGIAGDILVSNATTAAPNGVDGIIRATIIRSGAGAQLCGSTFQLGTVLESTNYFDGTQDETTALDIVVTGTPIVGGSGDITAKYLRVWFF